MRVLYCKRIFNAREGQVRVFEMVVAAVIIFVSFSASIFLIYPSHTGEIYERENLDRLGYNVLHNLVETGAIESILKDLNKNDLNIVKAKLKTLIDGIIPLMTYYNLTIFVRNEGSAALNFLLSVSNAPPDIFVKSAEASSTTVVYTSRDGKMYYLMIMLVKEGEKA